MIVWREGGLISFSQAAMPEIIYQATLKLDKGDIISWDNERFFIIRKGFKYLCLQEIEKPVKKTWTKVVVQRNGESLKPKEHRSEDEEIDDELEICNELQEISVL